MAKVWKIAPQVSDDVLEQLLYNRGLTSETLQNQFFDPKLENYQKDLKIEGIKLAHKRILQAIEKEELIIVYGDYDADGVCASAVIYHALTSLGAKVFPYIPHREKEGYGLSDEGLKTVKEKGGSLVITVDNGIVAIEQAKFAKGLGLDLIITDHHASLEEKPEAVAIVHSTKICGAAVAWCLIQGLVDEKLSAELLDLVGIATICDMVPLLEVNRAFAAIGLQKINQTKRVGLLALIVESRLQPGQINSHQVSFIIGPRINAIGRIEHALDALRLLCTKDLEKGRKLAKLLNDVNEQKKTLIDQAIIEARQKAQDIVSINKDRIIVLYSQNWIAGITGLVASRISEEFRLPTVVIAQGESFSKGSARSNNGLNIIETLRSCQEYLVNVGGHPAAAGFTIATDNIENFKQGLLQLISHQPEIEEVLNIEAKVKPNQLTKKLARHIEQMEPFGVGNPAPIIATDNMKATGIRTVGEGKHLKFKVEGIEVIAFSFGNFAKIINEGQLINLAYQVEINRYNGSETLQLKVVDLQVV